MSVIKTQRNTVYAYEPQKDDSFVQTYLGTAEGVRTLLTTRPIADYKDAVDFAVGIADQI